MTAAIVEESELDLLRKEFPHVDELYVKKNFPSAVGLARGYNLARSRIDPERQETVEVARKAKCALLKVAA